MASESPRKKLRAEVICPICLEYFADPVTLACEHSFCRACILQSWAKSPTSTLCPLCKRAFCTENLKPNYSLASFVEITQLLNDEEEAGGKEVCERHREPLELFCKDDKVSICSLCDKEHQGHSVIPVEEAVQECQGRISASLKALKKKAKETVAAISAAHEESENLLKRMEREREEMEARFRKLQPFLMKQESSTLARMRRARREMERKTEKHMDRMDQKLSSLQGLIQEMEEKRMLPASQLLQDVDSILQKSEQRMKLKNPIGLIPALKMKAIVFIDKTAHLKRAVKKFEAKDSLGDADIKLIPSKDYESVTLTDQQQVLPIAFKDWFTRHVSMTYQM